MRLNNEMRKEIVEKLLRNKFKKEWDVLREMEFELADAVYEATYTEEEHALIKQLPANWVDTSADIRCTFGGERHRFTFRFSDPTKREYRKCPTSAHYGYDGKAFPASHPLAKKNSKRLAMEADLEEREAQAKMAAKSMVFQYKTIERLIEAWPEVAPFVESPKVPMVTALALPVSQLNAMLGLG